MTTLIGGVLLAAGILLYVVEPVLTRRGAPVYGGDDDHDEGAARRRIALTALRDLEYDRATGKLDGHDYETLKAELSRDALRQLGRARDPRVERASAALEEEIAQLRSALRAGLECAECGHLNRPGARYCGHCGLALAVDGGGKGSRDAAARRDAR